MPGDHKKAEADEYQADMRDVRVPRAMSSPLLAKQVGVYGRALFEALLCYADYNGGGTFASLDTLAEAAGIARSTAQKEMKRLVELGMVREAQPSEKGRLLFRYPQWVWLVEFDGVIRGFAFADYAPSHEKRAMNEVAFKSLLADMSLRRKALVPEPPKRWHEGFRFQGAPPFVWDEKLRLFRDSGARRPASRS